MLNLLLDYGREHGDCEAPPSYQCKPPMTTTGDYKKLFIGGRNLSGMVKLGQWLLIQKQLKHNDELRADRLAVLQVRYSFCLSLYD